MGKLFIPTVMIEEKEEVKSTTRDVCKLISYLIIVFVFFLVVIVFYQQYEGWNLTDTMYFIIVTISTVGYGQPAPSNDSSRLFTIFFILIGIFVIFAGVKDFIHNNLSIIRDSLCKSPARQVAEDLEMGDFYHYRKRLVLYVVLLMMWMLIGAIAVKQNENWTWIQGFYFIVETSSTVGYGDLIIQHGSTKAFLCLYIIISTLFVTTIIRTFNASLAEKDQLRLYRRRLQRLQHLHLLYAMDATPPHSPHDNSHFNNGKRSIPTEGSAIPVHQLLIDILICSGKIDPVYDLEPWLEKLDSLTTDGKLIADREELHRFLLQQSEVATSKLIELNQEKKFNLRSWQRSFLPWTVRTSSFDDLTPSVSISGRHQPNHYRASGSSIPKERMSDGEEALISDEEQILTSHDGRKDTVGVEMIRSPMTIPSTSRLPSVTSKGMINQRGSTSPLRNKERMAGSAASNIGTPSRNNKLEKELLHDGSETSMTEAGNHSSSDREL